MNNRNKDLFFEHENDETAIVTLTDTEGNAFDVQVMASMEIEDEEKEYIAVLPVVGTEQFPEDQLIILIYSEDEDGNPQYAGELHAGPGGYGRRDRDRFFCEACRVYRPGGPCRASPGARGKCASGYGDRAE